MEDREESKNIKNFLDALAKLPDDIYTNITDHKGYWSKGIHDVNWWESYRSLEDIKKLDETENSGEDSKLIYSDDKYFVYQYDDGCGSRENLVFFLAEKEIDL